MARDVFFFSCRGCQSTHIVKRREAYAPACPACVGDQPHLSVLFTAPPIPLASEYQRRSHHPNLRGLVVA